MSMKFTNLILLPFHWIYMAAYWVFRSIVLIIAVAIILVGIIVGIYVGVWLMLFGGFADAINLFKTLNPITATDIAITLSKIIFAIPVGLIITGFCINIAEEINETLRIKSDEDIANAEKERHRVIGYDE